MLNWVCLLHTGARGFYVGYGTTLMREIPFAFIQFPIYEHLKARWLRALNSDRKAAGQPARAELPGLQSALCGSAAGAVAAALTTPIDVVRTRMMLNINSSASAKPASVAAAGAAASSSAESGSGAAAAAQAQAQQQRARPPGPLATFRAVYAEGGAPKLLSGAFLSWLRRPRRMVVPVVSSLALRLLRSLCDALLGCQFSPCCLPGVVPLCAVQASARA